MRTDFSKYLLEMRSEDNKRIIRIAENDGKFVGETVNALSDDLVVYNFISNKDKDYILLSLCKEYRSTVQSYNNVHGKYTMLLANRGSYPEDNIEQRMKELVDKYVRLSNDHEELVKRMGAYAKPNQN